MKTTAKQAKAYLNMRFEHESELYSIMHETTDNGVFNKSHVDEMDEETILLVVEDLKWRMNEELKHIM